jgi:mannose-6-phosphate isomerase-like protein (cupin superfamily)
MPASAIPFSYSLVFPICCPAGQGYFSNAATEVQQPLSPGDSIISLHGAATFTAGPLPQQQQQQQETHAQQQQQHISSPAWSQLLGWLQQLHAKQQQHAAQSSHTAGASPSPSQAAAPAVAPATQSTNSSSSQLVMLQLLLPSELLTGQMLSHHVGHCHAVAQQLPWGDDSAVSLYPNAAAGGLGQGNVCDVTPGGSIHAAQVCGLLVDAGLSPPSTQKHHHHHQQQQQTQGPHLHATTQDAPPAQQQQQQQQQVMAAADECSTETAAASAAGAATSDHSSNGTAASNTSSSSSNSGHVLPSLNQQQILKRALSDVGAFRLPHQTNRLALLFGPHSAPAVCCSFGVEVFEPGHVTPLHIHNTAHELFFVLAGKGEAVFRAGAAAADTSDNATNSATANVTDNPSSSNVTDNPSSPQRVLMSPGDVAVFPPGVVHGVDNPGDSQLYCLQMMLPNEYFVEWVRSGEEAGRLDVAAVQRLAAAASCG